MKILMLGWEFPPYISGGLGTACFGLTRALDRQGETVRFVMPGAGETDGSHVDLIRVDGSANQSEEDLAQLLEPPHPVRGGHAPAAADPDHPADAPHQPTEDGFDHAEFIHIPSALDNPYDTTMDEEQIEHWQRELRREPLGTDPLKAPVESTADLDGPAAASQAGTLPPDAPVEPGESTEHYGQDLIGQVRSYANAVLQSVGELDFDVIHAHDWMTFPAGLRLARATGKPLVVHVHSTEFDRSGEHTNPVIEAIERRGVHGALKVITVSRLTRGIVTGRYGVDPAKVEVVYNGIDLDPGEQGIEPIRRRDKIVLYLGRITFQKGPEYFIRAAEKVLSIEENVKFVVAGSGDLYQHTIELAAELGIGNKVLFTGFLRGADVDRVFKLADLYVMPSVSEPFGIAPLEAMSHEVPVLISKSSGVSEVLTHVLKVDFWDVESMADKILAVLRHPPLGQTLREHGRFEVRRLTWSGAAQRCRQVYERAITELAALN